MKETLKLLKGYTKYMDLPAIVLGAKKPSLDSQQLTDYRGKFFANVSYIPGIAFPQIIKKHRQNYIPLSTDTLIKIVKKAGEMLNNGTIEGESPEEYYKTFVRSTGLPISTAQNGLKILADHMQQIEKILKMEVPYQSVSGLDKGFLSVDNLTLAVAPYGNILGVITPSNHPAVHISWITAIVMKYSVIVKPGSDDPFTPLRVINTLLAAGLPEELISMTPSEHSNVNKIIDLCDRTIFYGNQTSIGKYQSPKIIPRGSGNSKIYVDIRNMDLNDRMLDIVTQSMIHDGGRRCTNASSIVVNGDIHAFTKCLSERLQFTELLDPLDPKAIVGCFKDVNIAKNIDSFIEKNSIHSTDITMKLTGKKRMQQKDGLEFLCPTVMVCDSPTAPLYGKEFPFPFVTVIQAKENHEELLSNSLAVSLITNGDDRLVKKCITNPTISKIIINAPTYISQIGDPHDGFLFPHLYKIKSFYDKGGTILC